MVRRLKAALTARSTVLVLLVLLAAAMTVAALVPQVVVDGQMGRATGGADASPDDRGLTGWLGVHHVFSTPWFAALSALFVLSLLLSTLEQFRLFRARLRQPPAEAGEGGSPSAFSREELEAILASEGYRRLAEAPGRARYAKHWIGYGGNALLHAGMALTVLFSVTYVLTEHRAKLHVTSGQTLRVQPGGYVERRGLLARGLPLPVEINLYRVEPTFGANDQLVDLASQLVFTAEDGTSREVRVAVNAYERYRGLIVYQLVKWGNAFYVELDDGKGKLIDVLLEMPIPEKRGAASYANQPLGEGRVLKAKYYASADRTALVPEDPLLVLRLYEGEALIQEVALRNGEASRLGPFSVRLARVGWWTEILFEGSLGTAGIFAGFALLLCGGVLTFFAVPREVVLRSTPDGWSVQWRTARFLDMYREERDRIVSRCTGGRVS